MVSNDIAANFFGSSTLIPDFVKYILKSQLVTKIIRESILQLLFGSTSKLLKSLSVY